MAARAEAAAETRVRLLSAAWRHFASRPYEAHGDAVLRMLSQEELIPAVRQMTDAGRAYHRAWAEKTFEPLVRGLRGAARERRLSAIVVATDLLVWKLLRRDMGRGRDEAERIVAEMVQSSPPPR
jgi:hypothetical protein